MSIDIKSLLKMDKQKITSGNVPIDIFENAEYAMYNMAEQMVAEIKRKNQLKERTLFILPVGPTMQYKYFVSLVNTQKISLNAVTFINMDEYCNDDNTLIDISHPLSFRKFMNDNVYSKISPELVMSEKQRIFPLGNNGDFIDEVIKSHGGVDICFGGIGINGHLAFNEPPQNGEVISKQDFVNSTVRFDKIALETLVVGSINPDYCGAYDLLPTKCVTIGLKQILNSKKIRIVCFREWHRAVVIKASFGSVTVNFPASLLQEHKDARISVPASLTI